VVVELLVVLLVEVEVVLEVVVLVVDEVVGGGGVVGHSSHCSKDGVVVNIGLEVVLVVEDVLVGSSRQESTSSSQYWSTSCQIQRQVPWHPPIGC
jgi:hypothetical protein